MIDKRETKQQEFVDLSTSQKAFLGRGQAPLFHEQSIAVRHPTPRIFCRL